MPTIDELRKLVVDKDLIEKEEQKRLKEKVLCAQVLLPFSLAKHLGINSLTMKASEVEDFVVNELENKGGNTIKFSIKYMMKTNKWIENLPEADI